jgi:hypothetical protein
MESEPLMSECKHIFECIRERKQPKADGKNGIDVVKVPEAAEISLINGSNKVNI